MNVFSIGNGQVNQFEMKPLARTLDCMHDQQTVLIDGSCGGGATEIEMQLYYWTNQRISEYVTGTSGSTLKERDYKDATDLVQEVKQVEQQRKYVLRRLTPTECLRLQGLPDWWVDGVNGSDSAIYKMAGNGLAIPCACDVLGRIAEELRNEKN